MPCHQYCFRLSIKTMLTLLIMIIVCCDRYDYHICCCHAELTLEKIMVYCFIFYHFSKQRWHVGCWGSHGRQFSNFTNFNLPIPWWLMSWRHKKPGHRDANGLICPEYSGFQLKQGWSCDITISNCLWYRNICNGGQVVCPVYSVEMLKVSLIWPKFIM